LNERLFKMLQQQVKLTSLLEASSECTERGLWRSAHWAAELAEAMTADGVELASAGASAAPSPKAETGEGEEDDAENDAAADADAAEVDATEAVKYRLAKTLFDLR
jgi:anaphase-promoting complex subunit 8